MNVKKLPIRVFAVGGGLVGLLVAGGAGFLKR